MLNFTLIVKSKYRKSNFLPLLLNKFDILVWQNILKFPKTFL